MAVKMVRNVHSRTNLLFSRFVDKACCELRRDGLSFLKSGSPEKMFEKHCTRF